ncbi:MAG: bifunctional (p)ppGpp synthetase/guanosine-3',5'-bis(diphosphate) 3'-pyrophosphohydrolase [Gammaproteobacteria bacterium]|nr:bifunctional (p)ppGpp synthetase/guanosine-3',5'-bis(diphosphate) 3'-pyrophosphohydrolase [Gammaproteobacteria bacterium]MDH3467149.1 bifunctional (p)ppGpp synthetase/guanosine-3',5'-bis(diphosphate) 3'-pyrophosphohydrolase [Gammaproteobacteria bacterium]
MQIPVLRRNWPASTWYKSHSIPGDDVPVEDLCQLVGEYLDRSAVDDIRRAYRFGADAHYGQYRRSGEPYIHHPLAVARIVAEMRMDSRSIMAAILHDVIEDTPTVKNQLASEFGDDVAELVDGVSKISQIEFDSKEEAEAENFRKMLLAMSQDIRVILIKLADRLHNMRTLEALRPDKRLLIARQTLDIYAAIANRLGLYGWSRELEDISFMYLYPKRYKAITKAIKRRQGNRKSVMKKLHTAIDSRLKQSGLQATVSGREKNVYSIYKKMQRKRLGFSDIQDIYAFRVIVDTADDCYRTLGSIHNLYKPIPGRFKDYIAIPKANGYQSLHTTVFGAFGESLELQIRTRAMHRIAEAGVASHWLYKSDDVKTNKPQELARTWLLELLDTQQQAGNPGEFLEHLKIDLFPDEVYVFTPKGDIKKLPLGATTLDFAFAVHTDVGTRCVGARVNHQPVPLHTVLNNGDHVEVMTSRSSRPTPSWLSYVVTSKARATIRSFLKNQRRKDSVRLGKKLLDRALKSLSYGPRRVKSEAKVALLESLNMNAWEDLLADIGSGKRLPKIVARQLVPAEHSVEEIREDQQQPLAIHGAEGMFITYAKCCRPIPGDAIIGFFTAGRGIVVHTADCPNIGEYRKHPEKWIHIHWAERVKGQFSVNLKMDTQNKRGVLARVATVIAEQESNINNVHVVERDGRYSTIQFIVEVDDRQHLANIMRNLRQEKSIFRLARVKG